MWMPILGCLHILFTTSLNEVIGDTKIIPCKQPTQSNGYTSQQVNYRADRAIDSDVETCSKTTNTLPRYWSCKIAIEELIGVTGVNVTVKTVGIEGNDISLSLNDPKQNSDCSFEENNNGKRGFLFLCSNISHPGNDSDKKLVTLKIIDLRIHMPEQQLQLCDVQISKVHSVDSTSSTGRSTDDTDSTSDPQTRKNRNLPIKSEQNAASNQTEYAVTLLLVYLSTLLLQLATSLLISE